MNQTTSDPNDRNIAKEALERFHVLQERSGAQAEGLVTAGLIESVPQLDKVNFGSRSFDGLETKLGCVLEGHNFKGETPLCTCLPLINQWADAA